MPHDLTRSPDAEDFRTLARSAPWLFTTLHWTQRATGEGARSGTGDIAEAWMDRAAQRVTVRSRGQVETVEGVPCSRTFLLAWAGDGAPNGSAPVEAVPDRDEGVLRRADGLVTTRPPGWSDDHSDPMYGNYRWTAMLDPAELADGVAVSDVTEVELRGRRTWQAVCRPLVDAYAPRCGCCPLLDSVASRLVEYGPDDPNAATDRELLPTAYLVSLDVRTGIVVDVSPLDGAGEGTSFVNEIHAVDGPLRPPAADPPAAPAPHAPDGPGLRP
ncbi:hypothetical protein ACI3EY_16425 [Ornithinimicrobium sp. LYQ92]|uniref:hypothetical protein n=1 Tax=Serinicoccus sp. LYQ92 TaxID=3378798 RepID=UPI003852761B